MPLPPPLKSSAAIRAASTDPMPLVSWKMPEISLSTPTRTTLSEISACAVLHVTPFEVERREIMPVAARHTIPELMDAARYFVTRTRRKLFFEYTLLASVNDQSRHVEALT